MTLALLAGRAPWTRASIAYNSASSGLDPAGNLYVTYIATAPAGYAIKVAKRLAGTGKIAWTQSFSLGNASSPGGIVVDDAGNAYVAVNDIGAAAAALVKYDTDGVLLSSQSAPFQGAAFSPLISAVGIDTASAHLYAAETFIDANHNGLASVLALSYDFGLNVEKTQLIADGPGVADESSGIELDGARDVGVGITQHVAGDPQPVYQVAWFSPGLSQLVARVSTSAVVDAICIDCTNIQIVGGDGQQGPTGSTLPNPLNVLVTFPFDGSPVSQLGVFYSVVSAPGGATGQSLAAGPGFTLIPNGDSPFVLTDDNGMASEVLTLGSQPGNYQIRAIPFANINKLVVFNEMATGQNAIHISLDPPSVFPSETGGNSLARINVQVTDAFGKGVPGQQVQLDAKPVDHSGGHDHDGDRPSGGFAQGNCLSSAGATCLEAGLACTTDQSGNCLLPDGTPPQYAASLFGGTEMIEASLASSPSVSTSAALSVAAPSLVLLPDATYYMKTGGRSLHSGPPSSNSDDNHYILFLAIADLQASAAEFFGDTGEIMQLNDMSLPNGGGFDLNGSWGSDVIVPSCRSTGHCGHRGGTNVDVENLSRLNKLIRVMQAHSWRFYDEGQLSGKSKKFPHFYWAGGH